jgi:hypothetical protein
VRLTLAAHNHRLAQCGTTGPGVPGTAPAGGGLSCNSCQSEAEENIKKSIAINIRRTTAPIPYHAGLSPRLGVSLRGLSMPATSRVLLTTLPRLGSTKCFSTSCAASLHIREAAENRPLPGAVHDFSPDSTCRLLVTENTFGTVIARMPAMFLSACEATHPTSVTCPPLTMMWIAGTAPIE